MNWQPIATAPKDGTHVLVCDKYDWFEVLPAKWTGLHWQCTWDDEELQHITHWMPIPEPPA